MLDRTSHWSTQQLAEFIVAVSSYRDQAGAARGALDLAAEALEAEVAALLKDGDVVASIGFAAGHVPRDALRQVVAGASTLLVDGLGVCQCLVAPVGDDGRQSLLLARSGDAPFNGEEASLARAMARTLALTQSGLATVQRLEERQRLVECLSKIQRAITLRNPLQEILDSIVAGAAELIGDEVVGLRLLDPDDPGYLLLAASSGIPASAMSSLSRTLIGNGAGGRAVLEDDIVVIDDYARDAAALPSMVDDNLHSAMAVPVREHGRPIGSLVVATHTEARIYSADEREILLALSEHASIALTDARTVRAMEHQAFHDALTGLPNRALFVDRLGQALKRSRQDVGAHCAVLFIDLDRFKMVNDSLGHAAGDELLVEIADRLKTSIRDSDTAARLGGDEFAVVTESVSGAAEALAMAARLRVGLNAPILVGGKEMLVSATVGVAIAEVDQDADELLRNADLAMYDAKGRGEEGFALYRKSMHAAALARLDLESSLRRAIELEQFEVFYQPVVELGRNHISGVEALLRWNHPERGLLSPAEFVSVAEDTGLIVRLGSWVLATAMGQARRWTDALGEGESLSLSVNLSARQLQRAEIVEEVRNALTASGLEPAALTLEITETVLMLDTQATLERLRQIKALGVKLAIDDFGTGYSSLGYLRRFPIDCLKIDRSFVKDLGDGPEQSAVASAIVALGHALHLTVIAEGIEEPRQVRELQQIGCEQGQGYLFSPPVPAAELETLLLRRSHSGKLTVVA